MEIRKGCFDWSEAAIARLREMHADGFSFSDIRDELGCTRNAAIGKAHRLKLESRQSPIPKRTNGSPHKPRPTPKRPLGDRGGGQQQRFIAALSRAHSGRLNGHQGGGKVERINAALAGKLQFAPQHPQKASLQEPASLNLTTLELTDATCKWAHGDTAPFAFCGHPTRDFDPYCPHHQRKSRTAAGRAHTEAEREAKRRHAQRDRRSNFGFVPAMQRANA